MNVLVSAHSGLRYVVLLLLLMAIVNAAMNLKSENYLKKDKMINLFAMVILHIQLLLGLILYFVSNKVKFGEGVMGIPLHRFYDLEHPLMMIVGILLITLGRKKAEKSAIPQMKHKLILRYYFIGLVIIFISIPWPFIYKELGAGYF
jgi:hypothetical protein